MYIAETSHDKYGMIVKMFLHMHTVMYYIELKTMRAIGLCILKWRAQLAQ